MMAQDKWLHFIGGPGSTLDNPLLLTPDKKGFTPYLSEALSFDSFTEAFAYILASANGVKEGWEVQSFNIAYADELGFLTRPQNPSIL